jgi:hypothetical protein
MDWIEVIHIDSTMIPQDISISLHTNHYISGIEEKTTRHTSESRQFSVCIHAVSRTFCRWLQAANQQLLLFCTRATLVRASALADY